MVLSSKNQFHLQFTPDLGALSLPAVLLRKNLHIGNDLDFLWSETMLLAKFQVVNTSSLKTIILILYASVRGKWNTRCSIQSNMN